MELIFKQNPWWFLDEWENEDKHIKEWKKEKYRWYPKWISKISLEPFSLNFVYGTRQTGKTTGVKLLIKKLIKANVEAKAIFYFDFEMISSLKELRKILQWYIEEKKREKIPTAYIFLDEVSSIEEWFRIVKFFIDQGSFEDDIITVLGSSTLGIIKAPERFSGRKGRGKILEILPLSFPEFIEVHGYKKKEILYNSEILKELWEKYKVTGGFPRAINQKEDAFDTLISGIVSEIYKHKKSLGISQDILASLLTKIPSPLSYYSIAQDVGISHKTVREYIEFFKDSLLLELAYWKSNGVNPRKEKKIFFRDPFILRAISFWTSTKFLESALYEGIVQEHLLRKFNEIYYFRNSFEIDCIAGDLKIEVKAGKPHRKYPRNVLILEEDDIPRFLVEEK